MKIYLARPISGHKGEDVFKYYEYLKSELEYNGYEVLCPMSGKGEIRTDVEYKPTGYTLPVATDKAIKSRDQWMVIQSDIVLLDLSEATEKSIGCMMELAWGDLLNKHTILVMKKNNIHSHAFVYECSDIVFETLNDAVEYLSKLTKKSNLIQ